MERSLPLATAVAVRDGMIIEVGTLESLRPWLDHHPHVIDDRFADQVIMPGLVEPHAHPSLMATMLALDWIPPEPWDLPSGHVAAATSEEEYRGRLEALLRRDEAEGVPEDRPLITFGYHAQFHGDLTRDDLDRLSPLRPLILWQRSFHELRCNGPALEFLDAAEGAEWDPHIELDSGRLYESGMTWALRTLVPILLEPDRFRRSLLDFTALAQMGGITTVVDAGLGIFDVDYELGVYRELFGDAASPITTYLMPNVGMIRGRWKDETLAKVEALIDELPADSDTDVRLRFLRAAKFFTDGAFIAQLMQAGGPGYIDGHVGAWLADPGQMLRQAREWWNAGFDIHTHVTGDLGVQACLDAVDTLLHEHPRFDHRSTLHHFGMSTSAQVRRLARLGMQVSANAFYLRLFSRRFAESGLGWERASQIIRLGSVREQGSTVSLHSDVPMGPLLPLEAASITVTRTAADGTVMCPEEALTPEDALRAITIDAAFQMRLDHRIGSLSAGKDADMVVLDTDPMEIGAVDWPSIGVLATIRGGRVFDNPARSGQVRAPGRNPV